MYRPSAGPQLILLLLALTAGASVFAQQPDKAALEKLVGDNLSAWSESDPARRLQLLETVWTADATYTNPHGHMTGIAEIAGLIDRYLKETPGARFETSSAVDAHHDRLRYTWRLMLPDGKVWIEGMDVGEVSADGRIQRLTTFFGPFARKP